MERVKKYINYFCYIAIGIFVVLKFVIKCEDWLDAISYAVSSTMILFAIYTSFIWKFNPLEKYPKLSKKYKGIIKTEEYGEKEATFIVKHNLLYTNIKCETNESKSISSSFDITLRGEDWILTYNYLNEPNILERSHSDIHYGTCVLEVTNKEHITGKYYTDRKTVGEIDIKAMK